MDDINRKSDAINSFPKTNIFKKRLQKTMTTLQPVFSILHFSSKNYHRTLLYVTMQTDIWHLIPATQEKPTSEAKKKSELFSVATFCSLSCTDTIVEGKMDLHDPAKLALQVRGRIQSTK
ncbi:hypothetical protein AVEN_131194-1 [Araneus ventricosus]|uniref:Uncharacterized protein n=1 Tax=Araneus ventricosus TaxID=182803 RepID=A0A4Y2B5D2_ARAVE|nr:hypothetical protein AVEN_131194-1 [Araneus ventricosus]